MGDGSIGGHYLTPVHVGVASWKVVVVGATHVCGIRADTRLFCWGSNLSGQIGDGTFGLGTDRLSVTQVGTSRGWTQVAPGDQHTCAIHSRAMWCWGDNASGELGNGTFTDPFSPNPGVPHPTKVGTDADWIFVAGGQYSSCGIRASHLLYCWGEAPSGDGTDLWYNVPTQASFDKWVSISVGGYHRLGLRDLS